jgi:Protein of unknown function (DUF422).
VLDLAFDADALRERLQSCEHVLDDMVSLVLLWGGINGWFGNWLPAAVAVVIGLGLVWTDQFDANLLAT